MPTWLMVDTPRGKVQVEIADLDQMGVLHVHFERPVSSFSMDRNSAVQWAHTVIQQCYGADLTTHEIFAAFTRDMLAAGFKAQPYHGRDFYEGPAVVVPRAREQDVIRATGLPLLRDDMGKGDIVLYPA